MIGRLGDGPERPLGDGRAADSVREGQGAFLDLRGKSNEGHDLSHAGARDPLATGNLGLGPDVAGVKLPPPLLGLPEELDHAGRPRSFGWLGRPPGLGRDVQDAVGGDAPFQGANTPVLERPLWPEGDLDGLFV